LAPEAAMVGMIGSFRPLKRWDVFLRASAIVAKSHPIEVLCVGEGALQGEMHALAHSLGIRERTRFLGARNDVPDILAALDVMVSASDTEGLSNVILEAMAAARPVVATRVGGTPELVIDGVTGYLTPAGAVDAMADRITDVLSDLPGAKAMGAAGRRRAESEFSLSACVAATVAVYDAMLDAKRGRGHTARAPERHV
jgi:glycosyltransferase involved in cell wall biosynthesis